MPQKPSKSIVIAKSSEIVPLFSRAIDNVRDDARDNPYLEEAMKSFLLGGTEVR